MTCGYSITTTKIILYYNISLKKSSTKQLICLIRIPEPEGAMYFMVPLKGNGQNMYVYRKHGENEHLFHSTQGLSTVCKTVFVFTCISERQIVFLSKKIETCQDF